MIQYVYVVYGEKLYSGTKVLRSPIYGDALFIEFESYEDTINE